MIWFMLFLWVAASAAIGLPLGRLVLRDETRFAVLLAYGILAGQVLQTVALVFIWSYAPLGVGLYLVTGLSLVAGFFLWTWCRRSLPPLPNWGLGRLDSVMVATVIALLAFLGDRTFTVAYSAWDGEAVFWRSGVTGWMSRGLFPPTNPLELSDQLHYRFGLNLLAAALMSSSGELATVSTAFTIGLLLALMVLAFTGASCRVLGTTRPGLVAALLAAMAGSLLWCERAIQLAQYGGDPGQYSNEMETGLLWGGNTLFMVDMNVSVAAGVAAFAIALWLTWEAVGRPTAHHSFAADLVALGGLIYLGLFYEVYLVALVAGVLGVACLQWWEFRKSAGPLPLLESVGRPLALVLLAVAIIVFRGGLLGGMPISGASGRSAGLVLNLDHFGSVVVPVNKRLTGWFPLLSTDALIDTDFILIFLPLLMLVAWRKKNYYVLIGLAACMTSLIGWLSVYPEGYPESGYHFGEAALVGYVALTPVAVAYMSDAAKSVPRQVIRWMVTLVLGLAIVPGLSLAAFMTFSPPAPTQAVPGSSDVAASQEISQSPRADRVLVPLTHPEAATQAWKQLYAASGPGAAARVIVGLSGHSIPLGFSPDFNTPSNTPTLYRDASLRFDQRSLTALHIGWVYVLPSYLTSEQRQNLGNAIKRQELVLDKRYGEEGQETERLLYRVVVNHPDGSLPDTPTTDVRQPFPITVRGGTH